MRKTKCIYFPVREAMGFGSVSVRSFPLVPGEGGAVGIGHAAPLRFGLQQFQALLEDGVAIRRTRPEPILLVLVDADVTLVGDGAITQQPFEGGLIAVQDDVTDPTNAHSG